MLTEPADAQVLRGQRDLRGLGDSPACEVRFRLAPDLPYFQGHFPRYPMLPGVVQLGWAILYARRVFGIEAPFRKVAMLKFQFPLFPDDAVVLALARNASGQVQFSYTSPRATCSTGRLVFGEIGA